LSRVELLEKFMRVFVGNGIRLVIREWEGRFVVHTIEIMQKVDETCPVKDVPLGDYFLHLVATDERGAEASMVCNWSQELLENLLENYEAAKEADCSQIVMFREPFSNDPNRWIITWGNSGKQPEREKAPISYIS